MKTWRKVVRVIALIMVATAGIGVIVRGLEILLSILLS
jgi:hypothetical protein